MKARYQIIQSYFGLFDEDTVLCVTDSLFHAVFLCECLEKAFDDRPYSCDFKKLAKDVDEALDFYPGESLLDVGAVYDSKNLEEFKAQKEAKGQV